MFNGNKVFLYINNIDEVGSALEYLTKKKEKETVIIITFNFLVRKKLDELGINYNSYDEIAKEQNIENLIRISKNICYNATFNEELQNKTYVAKYDISIVSMLYYSFLSYLSELILQYDFFHEFFKREKPDKIIMCALKNSKINYQNLYVANGCEAELFYYLMVKKGIIIETFQICEQDSDIIVTSSPRPEFIYSFEQFISKPIDYINKKINKMKLKYFKPKIKYENILFPHDIQSDSYLSKKSIFCLVCGEFYFNKIEDILIKLLEEDLHVIIFVQGEYLTVEQVEKIKNYKNLTLINDQNFVTQECELPVINKKTIKKAFWGEVLKEYQYFDNIIVECFDYLLSTSYQGYLKSLELQSFIINKYKPVSSFFHFPHIYALALFLKNKIPTFGIAHGWEDSNLIDTCYHASEYNGVAGIIQKKFYDEIYKLGDKAFLVGDPYLEKIYKIKYNKSAMRKKLDLPKKQKICIITESVTFGREIRRKNYIQYKYFKSLLELIKNNSNVFFIFRFHHGIDISAFKEYINNQKLKNIKISRSPNPLFIELAQAADVVIAHRNSSIMEATSLGVPVIYLSEGFQMISEYDNKGSILHATKYEDLQPLLDEVLSKNLTQSQIRFKNKDFYDYNCMGLDGKTVDRIKDKILELSYIKGEESFDKYREKISNSLQWNKD